MAFLIRVRQLALLGRDLEGVAADETDEPEPAVGGSAVHQSQSIALSGCHQRCSPDEPEPAVAVVLEEVRADEREDVVRVRAGHPAHVERRQRFVTLERDRELVPDEGRTQR